MKLLMMFAFVAMALGIFAAPVQAEDIAPPTWRGDSHSTMQEWDFLTPGNAFNEYCPPDGTWDNPYYDPAHPELGPMAYITEGPGSATYHKPMGPGPGGAWELGSWEEEPDSEYTGIGLIIPNRDYDLPGSYKLLRIQVTYDTNYETPIVLEPSSYASFQSRSTNDLGNGWAVLIEDWRYEPNPLGEHFGVADDFSGIQTIISEIVVDTICIPEPATMGLLVLSGLASTVYLLSRRRTSAGYRNN